MKTYRHSGCLGDVLYSLPVIQKLGAGELQLIEGGVPAAIRKYNNGPVPAAYEGKLSHKEIEMFLPLLLAQPYILSVSSKFEGEPDIDLDKFRGTVGQSFTGNFLATYFETFGIPYTDTDINASWLTVEPNPVAQYVICRSMRYRSDKSICIPTWKSVVDDNDFEHTSVFVGLPDEHADFCNLFDVKIPYYKCDDFLQLAQVIAGAEMFFGNQTFAYGIAQGLNVPTMLETLTWRPLVHNECYFPKNHSYYF